MSKRTISFTISTLLCIAVCIGSMAMIGCNYTKSKNVNENDLDDVTIELMNMTQSINVVSKSFYPRFSVLSEKLMQLRYGVAKGILSEPDITSEVECIRRELQQLGYYYDYIGKTAISSDDGIVYGASTANAWSIGGGDSYPQDYDIFSGYLVKDDNDFYHYANIAKAGDVIFISSNAVINLSDLKKTNYPDLIIPEGVIIASGRGNDGSGGGVLKLSTEASKIFTLSSNVRITGVVIEGPDATTHDDIESYTVSNGIELNGTGIEIDNCEISGFSGAGIIVLGGDAYIHDCYIHHIRGNGKGNGILVSGGNVKIEDNLFSNCRNGVAISEGAHLEAKNNIEVGNSIESLFRIGTDTCAIIKNNTVLGYTQPIILEGKPNEYVVENNLFSLNKKQYTQDTLLGSENDRDTIKSLASFKNNAFNIQTPYVIADCYEDLPAIRVHNIEVEAYPAKSVDYGRDFVPAIISVDGFGRNYKVFEYINEFYEKAKANETDKAVNALDDAISEFCGSSEYYNQNGVFSQEIDGVVYGAYVSDGMDPIGGGVGYSEIFTTGDYVVDTLDELVTAITNAKSGEIIFVEGHANIDVTSVKSLTLGKGVTLASNRGYLDENGNYSTGAILWSIASQSSPIVIANEGSRVSGIVINGRNPYQHLEHHERCFSEAKYDIKTSYYSLPMKSGIRAGNNVRVDNCEIFGFGHAGIIIQNEKNDVTGVRIDHCYIHHNQTNGLGYGICHNHGAESVIEYCLFNYNRHSIAATGAPVTGYIARYNIEMGEALSHCFDIHGGSSRGDGTNIAGTYCEMYNNTFLNSKTYPYWLRGVPEDYQVFHHNICVRKRSSYDDTFLKNEKATLYDNIFAGTLVK